MNFTIPVNALARKESRTSWVGMALTGVICFAAGMGHDYHGWLKLVTALFGAALVAGVVSYGIFWKAYQLDVDERGVCGRVRWPGFFSHRQPHKDPLLPFQLP